MLGRGGRDERLLAGLPLWIFFFFLVYPLGLTAGPSSYSDPKMKSMSFASSLLVFPRSKLRKKTNRTSSFVSFAPDLMNASNLELLAVFFFFFFLESLVET